MPRRTISERETGVREESPDVVVVLHDGEKPIVWECQNYSGDFSTIEFTLLPGVEEAFPRGYGMEVFGNWEQPKGTKAEQRDWADMVKKRVDRSPTSDGRLPMVKILDADGSLLWDAKVEYSEWMAKHGAKLLPRPDTKGAGVKFEMPAILKDATGDQLKALWQEGFKETMPKVKHETAKEILLARLTPEQISDVLVNEFEVEPDMSKYERK